MGQNWKLCEKIWMYKWLREYHSSTNTKFNKYKKKLRYKNTVQNANFLNCTFFWIFSPMCSTTYGQSTLLDKLAAQEKIKVRVKTENLLSPRACAAFSYMLHALHSVLKCEFEPQLQFWLLWSTYYPALMWFFWQTPYR